MNKYLKKLLVLTLAATMLLSISVNAFADGETPVNSGFNTVDQLVSTTENINLIKDYELGEGAAENSISPVETFEFVIEPYGVWNAGKIDSNNDNGTPYATGNIPLLGTTSGTEIVVDGTDRKTTVKMTANAGDAKDDQVANLVTEISIPEYNSVGDFWYKVTETNNHITGVFYGTNDAVTNVDANLNGAHIGIYYIHVQVINGSSAGDYIKSVTLHKTAPDHATVITNKDYNDWIAVTKDADGTITDRGEYKEDKKVQNIQNKYYAGELEITKTVAGNAGNKDQMFPVVVTFTKPAGTIITSDITFRAFLNTSSTDTPIYVEENCVILGQGHEAINGKQNYDWILGTGVTDKTKEATIEITFYVKDGTKVTFSNIPYGINYTIKEQLPKNDAYTQRIELTSTSNDPTEFNGNSSLVEDTAEIATATARNEVADANGYGELAKGSVSDAKDTWTITNERNMPIDVGVITDNAPFIAIIIVAAAAVVIYSRRRKSMIEE